MKIEKPKLDFVDRLVAGVLYLVGLVLIYPLAVYYLEAWEYIKTAPQIPGQGFIQIFF